MSTIFRSWRVLVASALAIVGLVLATMTSSAPAQAAGNEGNPGVKPPNSNPYGKSYSQWADSWWQWVDGIPASVNPMVDPDGSNCALGQSGQVWFIAGSPGGSYDRTCSVPHGKAIFFPVANFQEDQREAVPDFAFFGSSDCPDVFGAALCTAFYDALDPDPTDPANIHEFIGLVTDAFVDVNAKFATIDGTPVNNLAAYRSPSTAAGYTINLPDTDDPFDNYHSIFGYSFDGPDTYLGSQDGYYLMLNPLPPGEHTVSFGETGWVVTYVLTVQ